MARGHISNNNSNCNDDDVVVVVKMEFHEKANKEVQNIAIARYGVIDENEVHIVNGSIKCTYLH